MGGQDVIFLVGSKHRHDKVVVWHLLHELVDHIHVGGWNKLIHGFIFPFDTRYWLIVDEVTHILVHIVVTLHFVAVEVSTFEGGKHPGLETLIFSSSIAIFLHTENLTIECLDTLFILIILTGDTSLESILCLRHKESSITEGCTHERRILLLKDFTDALAEHARHRATRDKMDEIKRAVLQLAWKGFRLPHEVDGVGALLLVLVDGNDRLCIVGHRIVLELGCIGSRWLDVSKRLLYLLLHLIEVEVTYNDNGLQVWTIPLAVVATQRLVGEVHHDVHRTDRQTMSVLAVRIYHRQRLLIHAHHGRTAITPFLVDDTTLLINLLVIEQEVVAPVVKDEQTGIDGTRDFDVHIVDVINGLVERSVSIQILSVADTDALEIFLQTVAWEVGGAIEAHVFEEVCQTTLIIIFLDGAHLLGDVEEGTLLRPFIVTQVVGQSIGQHTLAHCWIHRYRCVLCRYGNE